MSSGHEIRNYPSARQLLVIGFALLCLGVVWGVLPSAANAASSHRSLQSTIPPGDIPPGGISGRVTDELGDGLEGIEVSVSWPQSQMVTTDANGDYVMSGLVPGSYFVSFSDPIGVYASGYQFVQISDAIVSGTDVVLSVAGIIRGTVTDSEGPLSNARVFVYSSYDDMSPTATTYTDADGAYSVVVHPGNYRIRFEISTPYQSRYYDGVFSFSDASIVTVLPGETNENINGSFAFSQVTNGAIRGRVRDALSAQRLSGIEVTAYDSTFIPVKSTTTDGIGEYELRGLPAGVYSIGFSDPQNNRYSSQYYQNATNIGNATAVQVIAGQSSSGINANLLLQGAGGIAGTVTGADTGAGLPNISVEFYRESNGQWAGSTQTNGSGYFSLSGLEVGTYRVRFSDWSGPYVDAELNEIEVAENALADASIQMTRGRSISGTVRNSNNQTVGDISVQISRQNGETIGWGYTQSNGVYQIAGLADGTYQLRFQDYSYRYLGTVQSVTIAGGDITRDVTLSQGGSISGQVVRSNGQALSGMAVELNRTSGEWAGYATTGAGGNFTISGLVDGSYSLRISSPNGSFKPATRANITVQNSGNTPIGAIALEAAAPPVVTVSSPNANVTADPETGQVTIGQQNGGARTDITIVKTVSCASGSPTNVQLLVGAQSYTGSTSDDNTFTFVIPADDINDLLVSRSADMTVQKDCSGVPASEPVGKIVLYDPSGDITDEITSDPVPGAKVTLYKVPGWLPKSGPGDTTPNTCQSHASKGVNDPWDQPAPTHLGVLPSIPGEIDPTTNPQNTSAQGRYGWNVAKGCWYVVVDAFGYETKVSPVVGVPPEVTDLDLALTPLIATAEEISIAADRTSVAAGETFQVFVKANSGAGIFGVSMGLSYHPAILEVTRVQLGGGLDADTIAQNSAVNDTISIAYAQQGSGKPNRIGSGLLLATLTFHAKQSGSTSVVLNSALFTDRDGIAATPTVLNSPIPLTVVPSPAVVATVQLQGRSGQDLTGLIGLEMVPTGTGNVLSDGDGSDAGGALHIFPVPAVGYRVRIDAPKYLAAEKIVTVLNQVSHNLTDPGPLVLLGGDINNDNRINIQDLVLIGVHFGKSQPADNAAADVNGDDRVNIQDLTIAAGNFNKTTATAYGSW